MPTPALPLVIALLVLAAPGAATAACHTSDAVYTSIADHRASLRFIPSAGHFSSDLALELKTAAGTRYRFVFDGGSAPSIFAISTEGDPSAPNFVLPDDGGQSPLGALSFYPFDRALNFLEGFPHANALPPYYIFMPDLSDRLWHRRDPLPMGMFRLAGCGRTP